MKRILIANGAFSGMLLASILQDNGDDNFFLGYFKNIKPEKSEALFTFFNYLIKTKKNLNFFAYKKRFSFDFQKLENDLEGNDISEIYLPINSSTKQIYKSFKNRYPKVNFIFYEEGLMSYVKPLLDSSLRKIMQGYKSYYIFYHEKLKNLLQNSFPSINFQTIVKDDLLKNIKVVQEELSPLFNHANDYNYALVLPQYYYQNNKKKTTKVLQLYYENIKKLILNDYKIIFKDHPKAKLKYSTDLKPRFNSDDFLLFEEVVSLQNSHLPNNKLLEMLEIIPVEVVAHKVKIDLVFSVYSTSLFTFQYLFNIKPQIDTKMLDNRINIFSLYPTLSALITKNTLIACNSNKKILYTNNKLLKILIIMLKLIHKYKE
ncbi:MAG: alpha-2,8-polysialyltransferase family protein [Alphaproteobacteria bacterium]|jgi:hypothetical protein|nr:alpha-2,8-polysialyltransferase family protein [Alphaproteobacteria bacterium]